VTPPSAPDPNTLKRCDPCPMCGTMMLWTQNAWANGEHRAAAYKCMNGHVIDPQFTRECPACGVHDTSVVEASASGPVDHLCRACDTRFTTPN
jgi:hypothetical protein